MIFKKTKNELPKNVRGKKIQYAKIKKNKNKEIS